ncbi:hypothetical protein [uncultured Kordia sp.]|uniref:hypothetical protein n=1 Tax=uncultured Kordia sp. TaxID=507699 RepID=UPI00262086C6|nr:hypothetical protein [uncultured Kordia sp.]
MKLKLENVENQIKSIIEEINGQLGLNASIKMNTCPYEIGITSQILVSVMGLLENKLDVKIPNSCYIFYDKQKNKQLSIKEASMKLIKIAK